ncbi:plasmid pRiA4b ORF-3 family protein [Myceligenerans halotolerans]
MSGKDEDELLRQFEAAIKGVHPQELRALADGLLPGDLLDAGPSTAREPAPRPSLRRAPRPDVVVYQVRADLDEAGPAIWRRADLRSDLTLDVVHQVLQDLFGWTDSHLHRFALGGRVWDRDSEVFLCPHDAEDPDNDTDGTPTKDVRLDEVLAEPGDRLAYVYDYGDDWQVTLRLEQMLDGNPASPAAICTGGRMAAPPDDSRGEFLDGGLAAVVDDPEHFDPAQVNEALSGPWYILAADGIHPRLRELLRLISVTEDGRRLTARLAALPGLPVVPLEEDVAAGLRAYLWLLHEASRSVGGLPLTQAGYLPPSVVVELSTLLPRMTDWRGTANREDLTPPVARFREVVVKKFGLLRKVKGRLTPTRAGRAADGNPHALFDHLADRLAPDTARRGFAADADLLVLAYASAGFGRPLPVEKIAAHLTQIGYRTDGDRPITGPMLWQYDLNAHDILTNVDETAAGRGAPRGRDRSHVSVVAAALAHAALTGGAW